MLINSYGLWAQGKKEEKKEKENDTDEEREEKKSRKKKRERMRVGVCGRLQRVRVTHRERTEASAALKGVALQNIKWR